MNYLSGENKDIILRQGFAVVTIFFGNSLKSVQLINKR